MKKIKKVIFQGSYKFIFGMILGVILTSGGVYVVTTIMGSDVTYSNANSGLSSTNVQGAIDELYDKVDIRKAGHFVVAYNYSEKGSNQCITGKEETCKRTTCYKNKIVNSCPAGTIIKYKVNSTDIIGFNVLFDEGNTMTIQSQGNIIYDTEWYTENDNTKGPLTVLPVLENATKGWINVDNQTYALGTTSLSEKGIGTLCDTNLDCDDGYILSSRTAKARMITVQEAKTLGCTRDFCPKYLNNESSWTLSSSTTYRDDSWSFCKNSGLCTTIVNDFCGAKAVIRVSK